MNYTSLNELIADAKIDFTKVIIEVDSYDGFDTYDQFEIYPEEYVRFAKMDLKETDTRSLINALSNSKRAIDSQIDILLKTLNLDSDNENIIKFCNKFANDEPTLPFKLKIIKAFNFAPVITVSSIRTLRNNIEHDYKIPNRIEVISAIELAELFIQSLSSKYERMFSFEITDHKHRKNKEKGKISGIRFIILKNVLTLSYDHNNYVVSNSDEFYPIIIAMMLSVYQDEEKFYEYLKYFVKLNNPNIPSEMIKIEIFE